MAELLRLIMEDREAARAERQANLATLQQLTQMAMNHNNGNGNGHGEGENNGHGDHRSKLRSFQNTNPLVFTKSEEPLDADDWLRTMENNLAVAEVGENEKVLYTTHYLAGAARAWWDSTRAMQAQGYVMPWEEFKGKFSKAHVPLGLVKRMRDEFRNPRQGSLSVVDYRDKFLTLSRYAPDDTNTNEKKQERFLNGLHDGMQCVLVSIPFADLSHWLTLPFRWKANSSKLQRTASVV
jgi:hypothetical protein